MTPLINLQNVSVLRGAETILSRINLHIQTGEFVAVIGKSGTGKSTLLHALAGHLPFIGKIIVPKKIGMVFQHYAVFPWMTVAQNIGFGLRMDKNAKRKIIDEHLHLAGLGMKADAYPAALSGGQQQRIAIARAFAHHPDLLLMDEPFGSLDAYTREQMQNWLKDVQQTQKSTVVFVTHSIEEALILADRIVILRDGSIRDQLYPKKEHADIRGAKEFWTMQKRINAVL